MRHASLYIVFICICLTKISFSQKTSGELTTLIPRSIFFKPVDKHSVKLSPDGKQAAYISGQKLYMVSVSAPDQPRDLTPELAGVVSYVWSFKNNELIAILKWDNRAGLYKISLVDTAVVDISPFQANHYQILAQSHLYPNKLVVKTTSDRLTASLA